jgi:SAM-dependent methyltransferase
MVQSLLRIPMLYSMLSRWVNAESAYRLLVERSGYRPGQRILDIGCGPGGLCRFFQPEDYVGIDISAAYIEHARRCLPATFHVMPAEGLGALADRFDLAVMCGVFHHLSDEQVRTTLAGLRRVLKPHGRFVLLEAVWPSRRWDLLGYLLRRLDRGRYVRTRAEWCRLLGEHWETAEPDVVRNGVIEYFVCTLRQPSGERCQPAPFREDRVA